MIFRVKNTPYRKESPFVFFKRALFSLFFLLNTMSVLAQDSIPLAVDFTEEKELKFQEFFFNALSQKSIGNYQKAIENLESCHQLLPNNTAVFFEFSKNHLYLNNTLLAKEYISRAIQQEPKNSWMQRHLVAIFVKERAFSEAIKMQQKLIVLEPKENEYLVKLYDQNGDYKEAASLLNTLEKRGFISSNLREIKERLEKQKEIKVPQELVFQNIYLRFETDKTYVVLKQILEDAKDKPALLIKYSEEGIALFPAQPFVYLINGSALNTKGAYKKALEVLQNGFDFVIEDAMEVAFYKEMVIAFKGLGNKVEEKRYMEKFKKLEK
jgi:tetratricopeptide (TPR) repeat protein